MLDLPSADGSSAVEQNTSATFLDEFRVMVLTPQNTLGVPEFTVFDTLVPRDHPANSRRFCAPLRYHHWFPSVHVDSDRCLGTLDRDKPFSTDPTQAVFTVQLVRRNGPSVSLVVRIQTLIEHLRSTADACVPWDVWGRDSTVIEAPMPNRSHCSPYPIVRGVRVILVEPYAAHDPYLHFFAFDLSRRGRSVLPLLDGDGAERTASFKNAQNFLLQQDGVVVEWDIQLLGDDKFMSLVSRFRQWKSGGRLMPLQDQVCWSEGRAARLGASLSGALVLLKVAST